MPKTPREQLTILLTGPSAPGLSARAAADPGGSAYGEHGGSHGYLVDEFVRAVAEDRMPAVHAWEAMRYMAAGVMAHKSALRNGEILEVPDWGDGPAS